MSEKRYDWQTRAVLAEKLDAAVHMDKAVAPGLDRLLHAVLNADLQTVHTWTQAERNEWRVAEEGWTEQHAGIVLAAESILGACATASKLQAYADAAMAASGELSRHVRVATLTAARDALDAEEFRTTRERRLIARGWDADDARHWARAEMALLEHGHDMMAPVLPADVLARINDMTRRLAAGAPDGRRRTLFAEITGFAQVDLGKCQADLPLLYEGLAALNREVARRTRTAHSWPSCRRRSGSGTAGAGHPDPVPAH